MERNQKSIIGKNWGNSQRFGKLNNKHLNNKWVKEQIKKKMRKYFEMNEKESTTYQNLRDIVKAVMRGKIISATAYIKKEERPQINKLTFHLKSLEK